LAQYSHAKRSPERRHRHVGLTRDPVLFARSHDTAYVGTFLGKIFNDRA
jgi:hypothetical protein